MLKANSRSILHFDMALAPYPHDAPSMPLSDFVQDIQKRKNDGHCVQSIENDRRVLRLADVAQIDLRDGKKALALLFSLGDRDKAAPGFSNLRTGRVRVVRPQKDEAGGLSVHAIVALSPTTKGGSIYRMVCEDVAGLGRSMIQNFLRAELKAISDDLGLAFERAGSREPLKMRPLVELTGHASEKLKESLKRGRLLNIELVTYDEKIGLDEDAFISTVRRDMTLSISKSLPPSESLGLIEKIKRFAKKNDYSSMRVRWQEENLSKPLSAKMDTSKTDAGEAFFIKFTELSLDISLPDISDKMSDELIGKMKRLVQD